MGVVSACALSFMSKYLHQSCCPKPMTTVDINENNQSSNRYNPRDKVVLGTKFLKNVEDQMVRIKHNLKEAQNRHKIYADKNMTTR
jgi:hypothetical protein